MIYLLRHGETEWSRVGRKQGRADSPLTELGVQQAIACGRLLKELVPSNGSPKIHTSPLGRARTTARYVADELGVSLDRIVIHDDLAEHDYGSWEGRTDEEIAQQFPAELQQRRQHKWTYVIPGGESYRLVRKRVSPWLNQHIRTEVTIAIAHEMVSRVIRGTYMGLPEGAILELKHPHNQIYRLADGKIETFVTGAILRD